MSRRVAMALMLSPLTRQGEVTTPLYLMCIVFYMICITGQCVSSFCISSLCLKCQLPKFAAIAHSIMMLDARDV